METELAIIGAGPAGMAAAAVAADNGIDTVVIDRQLQSGGQILRQPPEQFRVDDWLNARVYAPLHRLRNRFSEIETLRFESGTAVLGIERGAEGLSLHLSGGCEGAAALTARRVLVASGCYDMPVAMPGAQLPGVMAAGGIQAFIKSQQIVPGERFLFAGSHPLQLIVASQVAQAGGDVAGVLFCQKARRFLEFLRHPAALTGQLDNMTLFSGALWQLLRRGIPIRFDRLPLAARGKNSLHQVETGPARDKGGAALETIDCDRLGLCFGFLTNNDLLRQSGAECTWSPTAGGWVATHDGNMRSSVPGIYVAGETTGVAGARASMLEGHIAGLAIAADSGKITAAASHRESASLRRQLDATNRFAGALARFSWPGEDVLQRLMDDESVICKCEEVTAGTLRNLLRDNESLADLSAVKLLSRCGMGVCQGRYCHYQLRSLMAAERQTDPGKLGAFTARFPATPVPVSELCGPAAEEIA